MSKKLTTSYEPPASHFLPIDEEEAELMRMLEDPETITKPLSKETMKKHYAYFVADAKKSQPISIRIPR